VKARPLMTPPGLDAIGTLSVPYDRLVVAVGALPNTFGVPGVNENAMFMKEAQDGRAVRARIHACFEAATYPGLTAQQQKNLLTFVVVGGGPTGVELASELGDFIREDISVVSGHYMLI
jgi:NADH dehydrogenase FAD-containing subunit